jgi:hypothetical protein
LLRQRETRSLVAGNPNTSTEILIELGGEFPDVVTDNPLFPLLLLEKPDELFIRLSLAKSSKIESATLERLASVGEGSLLLGIAMDLFVQWSNITIRQ